MILIIKRHLFLFSSIVLGLLIWGIVSKTSAKNSPASPEPSPLFKVVVQPIQGASKKQHLPLVGRTEASRTVNLQAETSGAVEKFFVEEGDSVKTGTLCVKINEGNRRAKITSAQAAVKEKEARYQISTKLLEKKYRSAIDVAVDHTAWQQAVTDLKNAEIDLSRTRICAPFDGVVKKIYSEEGENLPLASGLPVLQIVSLTPLIVVSHVNESYRPHIHLGEKADLSWGDLGTDQGTISFIDPVADESTHTFRIKITVQNKDLRIPGGMTTHIQLPLGDAHAHEIPAGSLVLSDQGVQGVYGIDSTNKVHFYPTEIIDSTEEKIWVTGLPEAFSLIVVGQGFIKEGEVVSPSSVAEPQ